LVVQQAVLEPHLLLPLLERLVPLAHLQLVL
jgi:hypothetical protein